MTYDTIRGQFLQNPNWSRFRPTELHNFAKNVGVLGKRKSLKCLIFRDLPNLKSFKSGATRKCYPLRNELASNILERRKKVCTLHCTLTIFGAFHYFSLRLSLRKDKY